MNHVKKYLGIVWMLLGPAILFIFIKQIIKVINIANANIAAATSAAQIDKLQTDKTNIILQWSILLIVFTIIIIGFIIFGKYALEGAYTKKNKH